VTQHNEGLNAAAQYGVTTTPSIPTTVDEKHANEMTQSKSTTFCEDNIKDHEKSNLNLNVVSGVELAPLALDTSHTTPPSVEVQKKSPQKRQSVHNGAKNGAQNRVQNENGAKNGAKNELQIMDLDSTNQKAQTKSPKKFERNLAGASLAVYTGDEDYQRMLSLSPKESRKNKNRIRAKKNELLSPRFNTDGVCLLCFLVAWRGP